MTLDPPTAGRRRRRGVLAAALTLAVLAGCGSPTTRWVTPDSGDGATAPAGTGLIAWEDCEAEAREIMGEPPPRSLTFECGVLEVPADWDDPDNGETFEVGLIRGRWENQRDPIGSLLINPGGPGGSGVETAVYLADQLPDDVRRRFDIVGFDPRGTARSSPLACIPDQLKDELIGFDPDPVPAADFARYVDYHEEAAEACEEEFGDTLELYSTAQTVRDMEAIREALGDEQLTYLGYSYGTLLGAVYARLFPDRVRAFVLDGAVDPTQDGIEASEGQAAGFELAFDNFAAWCGDVGNAQCPIGPDARATVTDLLDQARSAPRPAPDGREATAGWVLNLVVSTMYSEDYWPLLASALDSLREGDTTLLFELGDFFVGRSPDGEYDTSLEMLTNVSCVDAEEQPTVEQVRELQTEWRAEYPLFGAPLALSVLGCAVWPDLHDPYPLGEAEGAPPIVVIGTLGDPATPYQQAPLLADLIGTGVLVTYGGEGHTIYPYSDCVNEAVDTYLLELEPPDDGLRCPAA